MRRSSVQGTWPAGANVQSSRKQGGEGKGEIFFKLENRQQKNQIQFRYIEKSSGILSTQALIMEEIQSNFLIRQFLSASFEKNLKPATFKSKDWKHILRKKNIWGSLCFVFQSVLVMHGKFAKNNKLIEDYSILNKLLAFTSRLPCVNTDLPLSFFSLCSFHLDS